MSNSVDPWAMTARSGGTATTLPHDFGRHAAQAWAREMERAQMDLWFAARPPLKAQAVGHIASPPVELASPRIAHTFKADHNALALNVSGATSFDGGGVHAGSTGPGSAAGAESDADGHPSSSSPSSAARHQADGAISPNGLDEARAQPLVGTSPGGTPLVPLPGRGSAASPAQQALATDHSSPRHAGPSTPQAVPPPDPAPSRSALHPVAAPLGSVQAPEVHTPDTNDGLAGMRRKATPSGPSLHAGTPTEQGPSDIRCHAQWSSQGVSVWLGMSATEQQQVRWLNLIVPQLRQSLGQQGHQLTAVVCNGRTVLKNESPVQPSPDRGLPATGWADAHTAFHSRFDILQLPGSDA